MSHNQLILQWLLPYGRSITPMQALRKFNCWALSSRISNLKRMRFPIQSKLIHDKKTGKTFAKYFL